MDKLNIFKVMNNKFLKEKYENGNLRKYKGFIISSIDRSVFNIPTNFLLKKEYNIPENEYSEKYVETARTCTMIDLCNNLLLTNDITYRDIDDNKHAIEQLEHINRIIDLSKIITLYDKRYNSNALILKSIQLNSNFIIRLKKTVFWKKREQLLSDDGLITLNLNNRITKNIKDKNIKKYAEEKKEIKLRIINLTLANGKKESIATNLYNPELTIDDFKKIYQTRWSLDDNTDKLKNKINLYDLNERKKNKILYYFYSFTYAYNLSSNIN